MEVKAKLKHYRMSPRKVRLIIDLIRGLDIEKALAQLENTNKKAALAVQKLLNSAIANAVNNFSLERDNLYIQEAFVDQGPALKRWMPRAHGRASQIKKYTSHITLILEEKVPSEIKKSVSKKVESSSSKDNLQKDKKIKTKKVSLDEIKKMDLKKESGHLGQDNSKIKKQAKKSNIKSFIRKTGDK
ncbi:50S ribosomal protein L22 [bacterium]|nr:50S ribosomal protein L22 [bacterium]